MIHGKRWLILNWVATVVVCSGAGFAADTAETVDAKDSRPEIVSRTGGKGAEDLWKSPEDRVKAADAGDPVACYELGEIYLNGSEGMAQDVTRAVGLLERSAEAGNVRAAFRLGKLQADGERVPKDLPRAYLHYLAAARGGSAEGQFNLGAMLSSGRGVKRDYVEGLAWLIVASKNGADPSGEKQLRDHLTNGKRANFIANAERRAAELAKEIAAQASAGSADATIAGVDATSGAGASVGTQDAPKASTGVGAEKVRVAGSAPGRIQIAMPTGGIAMPKLPTPASPVLAAADPDEGPAVKLMSPSGRRINWSSAGALEVAAGAGQPDALSDFGQVLLAGALVPADPVRAVALLEQGAKAGSGDAAYQLAEVYARGIHQVRDHAKALEYFRQAARAGSVVSMFNVGAYLANGQGAARDYTEALAWLLVAKKRGLDQGGQEQRIRAHLQKTASEQIAAAEARAAVLEQEIAASKPTS